MNWIDPFLLKFRDQKALPALSEVLKKIEAEGLSRIHVQGMDFILKDCHLVWLPSQISAAARLLGASVDELGYAWYLEDKAKNRKIDLPTLAEAIKRDLKWRLDDF